jgi:hypothetical protein
MENRNEPGIGKNSAPSEEALKVLAESSEEGFVRRIRLILFTNLDRGRVQSFFREGKPNLVLAYVSGVAKTFAELNGYLHGLQSEQNIEAWEALFERMQTWAYNFFYQKYTARTVGDVVLKLRQDAFDLPSPISGIYRVMAQRFA